MNVIQQIVKDGDFGSQTIKMVVRDNERGPKGEKGDTGRAATITAGRCFSVAYDAPPAVSNVGTETDAIFQFYIPRGKDGDFDHEGNRLRYGAPDEHTEGAVGELYTDTSGPHTYQCTKVDVDVLNPSNTRYTWTKRW